MVNTFIAMTLERYTRASFFVIDRVRSARSQNSHTQRSEQVQELNTVEVSYQAFQKRHQAEYVLGRDGAWPSSLLCYPSIWAAEFVI